MYNTLKTYGMQAKEEPYKNNISAIKPNYAPWITGPYGPCLYLNGVCQRNRNVICSNIQGFCDPKAKPAGSEKCASSSCPYMPWIAGPWRECTKCGPGFRTRGVTCSDPIQQHCDPKLKPADKESCVGKACDWIKGPWGPCRDCTLGVGKTERTIICSAGDPKYCADSPKPYSKDGCPCI